jgi:hypothetical protein
MEVIRLTRYLRGMKAMGFNESEMRDAELSILSAPEAHPVVKGLKGARKARVARPGMGKRGGGRVIYYLMIGRGTVAFLMAYPKNEKDDLTNDDRKAILSGIELLAKE